MSSCSSILFGFVLLCMLSCSVEALKCYECSNLQDERCGKTFDFAEGSTEARDKYLKECEGELSFCRKLEYEDDFQGKKTNGLVITRSCWTSPGVEGYKPSGKCKEMFRGQVCYCDEEMCNGSERIGVTTVTTVLLGLLPLALKMIVL